ncbi:MAG: NAD-dependent epimerase/dehydratase family protein [Chloroflexi bacterium]|nr:NAD-dependent epimerase/dehydratase family protein [Chloroflexota bacterium]
MSPYGVTKLAVEHLGRMYAVSYGVPSVTLRYFTVYGPRQRPDMAFHRLIRSFLTNEPFVVFGDGRQSRSFTYVDVVEANLSALLGTEATWSVLAGQLVNIGGKNPASIKDVIELAQRVTGGDPLVRYVGGARGDARCTEASLTRARAWLSLAGLRAAHQPGGRLQRAGGVAEGAPTRRAARLPLASSAQSATRKVANSSS